MDQKEKWVKPLLRQFIPTLQSEFGAGLDKGDKLRLTQLDNFDVLIDFSRPEASLRCYYLVCKGSGKAMVIGTTGFS